MLYIILFYIGLLCILNIDIFRYYIILIYILIYLQMNKKMKICFVLVIYMFSHMPEDARGMYELD